MKISFETGLKICYKCNIKQSINNFGKNKNYSDGLGYYCRNCRNKNGIPLIAKSGFKFCSKCRVEQPIENFGKARRNKDGLKYNCTLCRKIEWKETHPDKPKAKEGFKFCTNKNCRLSEIEQPIYNFSKCKREVDTLNDWCKLCVHDKYIENREDRLNKQKIRDLSKKEELNEYHKKYNKDRRLSDPLFKLSCYLRARLWAALKSKSWDKNTHFVEYIGCSLEELKIHLEKQFQLGMSWENHTIDGWHIDHIIPLDSAKSEEELYKLCHYTNLQPLWADDNFKKGNKILGEYLDGCR